MRTKGSWPPSSLHIVQTLSLGLLVPFPEYLEWTFKKDLIYHPPSLISFTDLLLLLGTTGRPLLAYLLPPTTPSLHTVSLPPCTHHSPSMLFSVSWPLHKSCLFPETVVLLDHPSLPPSHSLVLSCKVTSFTVCHPLKATFWVKRKSSSSYELVVW